MRLELTRHFAVSLEEGFDYIVDPRHWPEYWPGLIRVQPGSRWRVPGDRARVVMRLLGRAVERALRRTLANLETQGFGSAPSSCGASALRRSR
jgi:hypothetical protein